VRLLVSALDTAEAEIARLQTEPHRVNSTS
jgi:hypothetical protein